MVEQPPKPIRRIFTSGSEPARPRAYGLLLSGWYEAEDVARRVLTTDGADQFAMHVAGEAALQRGARDTALEYVKRARESFVVDRELCALITNLHTTPNRKLDPPEQTPSASAEDVVEQNGPSLTATNAQTVF